MKLGLIVIVIQGFSRKLLYSKRLSDEHNDVQH